MFWYFYIQSIAFVMLQRKVSSPGHETILDTKNVNHYDKLQGYDMRHPGMAAPNETLLLHVGKNMLQLELLEILRNPLFGMRFKMIQFEDYERLFGESRDGIKSDLTAGGLFGDFYFDGR